MATNSIKLLTGNSHPELANLVADRYIIKYCYTKAYILYLFARLTWQSWFSRLGIELTKIMVLQYSNQETSVTIGESVRDEDGMSSLPGLS
jgi:ribose-phosphate pyrophosphokinase